MDEEDAKRKREQEAQAHGDDDIETKENIQTKENDDNPGKKKAKRRKLKRTASMGLTGKRRRIGPVGSSDTANEVARRVYEIMDKHKENFFVIRLHPQNTITSLPPIKDPDPLVNSELMECRGAFLERAREKHLEFSSLRRAKFSTLAMIYDLHNENRQPLMYTCNICNAQLETPWHCKQCIEYDLCPRCYETENHPHPMVKIGLGLDDCNKGQEMDNDTAIQESGRDKLSRLVKALGHSCSCRDANCRVYACKTMKLHVQHFRIHTTSGRNQCSVCRILSYLCYYHSKTCHELKCPVPLCPKLKAKMKQQQKQQRLKQTQMLRRRMATMQRCNSMTPNHQPTPPPSQPYQQCSQSSTFDCVSSPMSTSMQSSPFSTNSVTTVPFSISSPMSRTQSSSIQSPQQSPFFYPSNASNSYSTSHPKSYGHSPSIPRSPSVSSIPGVSQSLSTSVSPYNQPTAVEGDSLDMCRPIGYPPQSQVRYPTTIGSGQYVNSSQQQQSMARSFQQDRLQSAPMSNYPVSNSNIMQHHPTYSSSNAHSSLVHRSPNTALIPSGSTDLSPSKPLKVFSHQPCINVSMDMDTFNYSQQMIPNQRFHSELQQSNYAYSKQPVSQQQQRLPSQVMDGSSGMNYPSSQQQFSSNTGSNWKQSGSGTYPYTMVGSSVCSVNNNAINVTTSNNIINNYTYPGATPIIKPSSVQSQSSLPNSSTPIPPSISLDDLRTVQQAYTTIRQRGAPASEFSNWLNSNPQYIRTWQYIQQSNMYNQQQQLQPTQLSGNGPLSCNPYHITCQQSTSYPVCPSQVAQVTNNSSIRSTHHQQQVRYQYPQSTISNSQQLSWSQQQQQQQTCFRSSCPNTMSFNTQISNQQFSSGMCQQPNQQGKPPSGGPNPSIVQSSTPSISGSLPTQRYMKQNISPTSSNSNMLHSSQHLSTNLVSISSSAHITTTNNTNIVRCSSSGMMPQYPHINTNQSLIGTNKQSVMCPTGVGVMGPRSVQPSPHYSSSVMLSQLLGPGQPSNNNANSNINSVNSVLYEYSSLPNNKQSHQMIHPIPSNPNMLPVNHNYQDGSNI